MKYIAIFRVIQWFTDVYYSKINDLFFSSFFLNLFLLLLVQKKICYKIFEEIIKSSIFNMKRVGVLSWYSINLDSDFFLTNKSTFSLAEFLIRGLFVFFIKIFWCDWIKLKEPINLIFVLSFCILLYYDKTTIVFADLFHAVNSLLNILACFDICFFVISTIFMQLNFLLNYFFLII